MSPLTDRKAIQIALWIAIDSEESLVDAYRGTYNNKIPEDEPGVQLARKRIAAFKRVLSRYYGGEEAPDLPKGKLVSISQLMKGTRP